MNYILDELIQSIPGVGELRTKLLEQQLGIRTVRDLLLYAPLRYIDRSKIYRMCEVDVEQTTYVQFRARITSHHTVAMGRKSRLVAYATDGTGTIELTWFRGINWALSRVTIGREYIICGRPALYRDTISIAHPEIEPLEKMEVWRAQGAIQGVYSTTEKLQSALGQRGFHNIISWALKFIQGKIEDYMPKQIMEQLNLMPLEEALRNIHFPVSIEATKRAEYRLKFDELLGFQLSVQGERSDRMNKLNGSIMPRIGECFNRFYNEKLPFNLTEAQKRVVREIRQDTVTGYQMNRLLQGDVGSGKTIVALMAMLIAIDNGFQSAMMAPTEILARQHYLSIKQMCEGLPVKVGLIMGATKPAERRTTLEGVANGEISILIGTHAILEDEVIFKNLGLAIIDEQHRFGVAQRARLWRKSVHPPHILVMTATPIPRTLAMTLYGDLDVSVIDELPPGRKPIRTVTYKDSARLRLQGFMREQIALGRQIYVVYPLIQESEALDYKDLQDGFLSMCRDFPQPQYQISVCHGKMKPEDKEESMRQFKAGETHILVATSVIEVGVDVPNASVMVIESAERFGLSQLHQLRGRVGRGKEQSFCILMTGDKLSTEARKRIDAMCQTTDGFRLSELDLQIRGSGDISGTKQSGDSITLKMASPTRDIELLNTARGIAEKLFAVDPTLSSPELSSLQHLRKRYSTELNLDFSLIS